MKRRWVWAAVILASMHGLVGCMRSVKVSDSDVRSLELRQLIDLLDDQQTVLIDVRPSKNFQQGSIPGAINIPLPNLKRDDERLAEAKQIVVYSSEPGDMLGRAAAKKLMAQGYKNVYSFPGGLDQWQRQREHVVDGTE